MKKKTKPQSKPVAKKVVAKKVAAVKPKPVVPPAPKKEPEYKLSVSMNGEIFLCATDDIKTALLELSPSVFKTKVVINVANKFDSIEKVMMIHRAKMLFRNEMAMDVFIKNVLLGLKNG